MKRLITVISFSLSIFAILVAEPNLKLSENNGPKLFYFGPGLAIGGFYPSNINDFMDDYYGNLDPSFGTFSMLMYFGVNLTGSFFFSPYTELQLESEWVFSPKFILINDETDYFSFSRLTPGIKFNAHIPLGKRVSYYIGPGISYSFLTFKTPEEKYTAGTLGYSAQTGIMLRFRKIAIQPGFTFNFIKSDNPDGEKPDDFYGGGIDELSYVGGQIGCKVLF